MLPSLNLFISVINEVEKPTDESTYMSDLRPSCFCGRMTWAECESLVSGIGWLIIQIARATFPTFFTCQFFHFSEKFVIDKQYVNCENISGKT